MNVRTILAAAAAIAVVAGGVWAALRWEGEAPAVAVTAEPAYIGRATPLVFAVEDRKSGLRQVRAWVKQGAASVAVAAEDFPARGTPRREYRLTLDAKELGLSDGPATLLIAAQDHSLRNFRGNVASREIPVTVDTVPPRLEVPGGRTYVNRGGSGVAAFRVEGQTSAAGVEVDGRLFPGYPAGGDGQWRLAFFAVAPEAPAAPRVEALARDAAGNEARRALAVSLREKSFRADTINVSDGFLDGKIPEFRAADPSLPADTVQAFLVVNRDWRARDHARLRELCATSVPERLWRGAFLQMPNTKSMAGWAEPRTYLHDGEVIDRQTHLGIDLASTAGAPVPAGNAGVVAFAGELGIYGQTVLLDHGQGLFSLYGHLSGIAVREGERVERGATLGSSGRTGMAGGDHLHFSVLLSGEFVSPLEWLDGHWIADNVEGRFAQAGAAAP